MCWKKFFPRILETGWLLPTSLIVSIFLSKDSLLESLCIMLFLHCSFQEKVEKGTQSHESQHSVSWNFLMDFYFLLKSEKKVSRKEKLFENFLQFKYCMCFSCKFGLHFVMQFSPGSNFHFLNTSDIQKGKKNPNALLPVILPKLYLPPYTRFSISYI